MSTLLTNNVQINWDSSTNIAWFILFAFQAIYLMTVQTLIYCARKQTPDSPKVKKKAISHKQKDVTPVQSTVTNTITGPSTSPIQTQTKNPIVGKLNVNATESHAKKVKKVKKPASNRDHKKKTSKPSKPSSKSKTSASKKNTTKRTEEKPHTKQTKDRGVSKVNLTVEKRTAEAKTEIQQTQVSGDTKVSSITKLNETQTCENLLKTSIDRPPGGNKIKDENKLDLNESEDDDDLTLKDVKSLEKDDRPPTIDE